MENTKFIGESGLHHPWLGAQVGTQSRVSGSPFSFYFLPLHTLFLLFFLSILFLLFVLLLYYLSLLFLHSETRNLVGVNHPGGRRGQCGSTLERHSWRLVSSPFLFSFFLLFFSSFLFYFTSCNDIPFGKHWRIGLRCAHSRVCGKQFQWCDWRVFGRRVLGDQYLSKEFLLEDRI